MSFWDFLFGAPKPQVIPAEPLKAYPSVEDARFAQAQGLGYGDPNAAYLEGLAARAFGSFQPGVKVDPFVPGAPSGTFNRVWGAPSTNLTGQPGVSAGIEQQIQDMFNQAQLAATRLPVAALGLEGRNTLIDVSGRDITIPGAYSPQKDMTFVSAAEPSALVHEALHRGFEKLKGNPALPPDIAKRIEDMQRQEFVVRQLMQQFGGDPEQGPIDKQQKAIAEINPVSQKDIDTVNAIVADIIAKSKPRGPR